MNEDQIAHWLNRPLEERLVFNGRKTLSLPWLSFVVLSFLYLVIIFCTDLYGNHDGLGDDGAYYGTWIRYFSSDIPSMGLHSYSAQRIFPVFFVWKVLTTFHLPLDAPYIVRAFQWINVASVVLGFAAWNVTARELSLSLAGYIFGTTGIFLSCAVLKWIPFDPVLDDALAFGLASITTMAFLARRYILLAFVTLIGAFTWPSFIAIGAALLFFPRRSTVPAEPTPIERMIADVIAGSFAGWITVAAAHLSSFQPPNLVLPAAFGPFRLSCAILGLTLFFGLRPLLRIRQIASEMVQRSGGPLFSRVLGVGVTLAFIKGVKWISSSGAMILPQPPHVTYEAFADLTLFLGVQRPGAFIVAHTVFFGPVVLLMILKWPHVCEAAARYGAAPIALFGLALLMGLNSESRRAVAFVPVLVPFVTIAACDLPWNPRKLGAWIVLSLFFLIIWHPLIRVSRFGIDLVVPMMGPWVPNGYMIVHSIIALVLLATFFKMAKGAAPLRRVSLVAHSPAVGG